MPGAREIAQSAPLALESIRATLRLGLAEQVCEAMIREQAEQQAPLAPPTHRTSPRSLRMPDTTQWIRVADAQRLAEEPMLMAQVDGLADPVVIYKVGEELYATDAICTHGHALLADGWLEGHVIECPFHGGCFDVRTGRGLGGPIYAELQTYPVRIAAGDVELAVPTEDRA